MGLFAETMRLESPALAACLLLVPLVVIALRGSLAREPRWRRIVSTVLRAAVLSLVVVALCAPSTRRPPASHGLVLLIDQSASLAAEADEIIDRFGAEAKRQALPNHAVLLPFGAEPGKTVRGAWPVVFDVDATATDLIAALHACGVRSPGRPAERLVLLSDGNATTDGDVVALARTLHVPVDTVPLSSAQSPDVWIESLRALSQIRPDDMVPIEVTLHANCQADAVVRIGLAGTELGSEEIAVGADGATVSFKVPTGAGPRDVYRVALEAESVSANHSAEVAVWHAMSARALLVGRDTGRFSRLVAVLGRSKINTETISAGRLPREAKGLSEFALVVLSDVSAEELDAQRMTAIQRYVQEGGGLIVFGGPNSLTAGAYRDTPLEAALPVVCQYDATAKRPSLAMVLVIDQSTSMNEGGAIDLAKKAMAQTVAMLDVQDQLGVVAFEDTSRWLVPLGPCDDKQQVLGKIGTLAASGGTNMHPAIAKAHLALDEAFADLKHIIVLTDGISYPGDFDALASDVAASGITVSTVAVGSEAAEPVLKTIAELGGGNYHHCMSAADLPEIFTRETAKAARMGIREEPFLPKSDAALESLSLAPDRPPALLGYVQTKAKADARVGMVSDTGDPLVVWWRCGRGTAALFTSDLDGDWSQPWRDWQGLEPLWAALAEKAVRPEGPVGYRLWAARREGSTQVRFDAIAESGEFENDDAVRLSVLLPDQPEQEIILPLIAPGQYGRTLDTPTGGIHDYRATCEVDGKVVFSGRCSTCPPIRAESIPRATDTALLEELAQATGGRFNPPPGELFPPRRVQSYETIPLWHYVLALAIVLYLIELAVRRYRAGTAGQRGNVR